MSENVILRFEKVSKRFPGVLALDEVSFDVKQGEVHALVGENGAGKSTLIKIVTGVHRRTSGEIYYEGKPVDFHTPHEALARGIAAIYQEFNLIPALTVAENIFMGHHFLTPRGLVDWTRMRQEAKKLLDFLDVDIDVDAKVRDLGVAKKQVVEIAKALSLNARILIMDEPTATLAQKEIETLFRIIRFLKEKGVTIIYISHRLEEIFKICDRVTVLRDGKHIATRNLEEISMEDIIRMMVGRNITNKFPRIPHAPGEEVLRVEGLTRHGVLENISFSLRRGEILGIAGMVGSGRTELLRAIYGVDPIDKGEIYIRGERVQISSPVEAINLGIALLPEERKTQGLVLLLSVLDNIGLPVLPQVSKRGFVDDQRLLEIGEEMVKQMNIKTPSLYQKVMFLSGGNQQKVVLGKWFARNCDIYLFDEPTRGIDVGAKVEIYHLMNKLIEKKVGIIMVSSELPEILGMSDRILVMREGRIVGELNREEATQEAILSLAVGGNAKNAVNQ
ncbi:MAG: ribose transport system ATP-binding protein [Candidatus Atribacteria bacterium]|uniref:sugar ABC transporter ATP-binding protein n=1 Tax=Atrimonas thermophila TaxID=3064161 RepID=UPI0024AAB12F|nr:ribose transport system ATP-binding protein [Candidatus Atribacteria bacterium]